MQNVIFETKKKNVISKADYANTVPASLIHPDESLHDAHIDYLDLDLFANTTFIKDHRGDVGITKVTLNEAMWRYWNDYIYYKCDSDNKINGRYEVDIYSVAEYYFDEDKPLLDYIDQHLADVVEVHTSLYINNYPADVALKEGADETYRYEIEIKLPDGRSEVIGAPWHTPFWSI